MVTPPGEFQRFQRGGANILRLRPAWGSYWRVWIACGGVIALWSAQRQLFDGLTRALGFPAELSVIGLLVGLAPIIVGMLYHRYTRSYEIEDGVKLRASVGFIARVKREFSLTDKIQADAAQSVPARLLNYGTIGFWTGDDRSRLEWIGAPDPDRIVAYIDSLKHGDARQASRQGGGQRKEHAAAPSAAARSEAGMSRAAPIASSSELSSQPVAPHVVPGAPEAFIEAEEIFVPLATPSINILLLLFDGEGVDWDDHKLTHNFRIKRWLKSKGDYVAKNEPITIIDGAPMRAKKEYAGLNLKDPVVYAPESGQLAYVETRTPPMMIFGAIKSTRRLIAENMDIPFRSELMEAAETALTHLGSLGYLEKLNASIAAGKSQEGARAPSAYVLPDKNYPKRLLSNLPYECHLMSKPLSGGAYPEDGYLIARSEEWSRAAHRMETWKFDFDGSGLPRRQHVRIRSWENEDQ